MAQKQKKGMLRKDYYYDDIVEQLKLGLTDDEQKSLVQDITAEMQFKPPVMMVPTLASLICSPVPGSDPLQMSLYIGKIANGIQLQQEQEQSCSLTPSELELVERYPSSMTWNVLIRLGIVSLPIDDFIEVAVRNEQTSQRLQLDLEELHAALKLTTRCSNFNEAYLSIPCTLIFGFCTNLLEAKCTGNFEFKCPDPLSEVNCYPAFTIVHKKRKVKAQPATTRRVVLLVAELKTNVPVTLDFFLNQECSNSLAQLIYSGTRLAKSQKDFMPLLVLTNGVLWHFFEIDQTGRPTRYSNVTHTRDASVASVPLTKYTNVDATAVMSEIIAFVQRNEDNLK